MVRHDKVASRYAKAILEYLKDAAKTRSTVNELQAFATLINDNGELSQALTSELFTESERRAVIEDLSKRLHLSADTVRILLVLSDARRLNALERVADKLKLLLLESAGTMPIEVQAANTLSSEEREKVERRFSKILGKNIEASYVVNPFLIGGLRVTAAGRTYDGTLAGWLETFEEQLVGGRL